MQRWPVNGGNFINRTGAGIHKHHMNALEQFCDLFLGLVSGDDKFHGAAAALGSGIHGFRTGIVAADPDDSLLLEHQIRGLTGLERQVHAVSVGTHIAAVITYRISPVALIPAICLETFPRVPMRCVVR